MTVDVSIILPIYNIKREYLERCVDSLLAQTKNEIEIILVNDGSTNDALEVCRSFEKKDERIVVIDQENKGVSVARNAGIDASRGQWLCFVDPDDWVAEEYVQELYQTALREQADITICNCYAYYNDEKIIANRFLDSDKAYFAGEKKDEIWKQLISKGLTKYYPPEVAVGTPWAKIFNKAFVISNQLRYVVGMARMQDNIFCLYAMQAATKIAYNQKFLYYYRKENLSACYKYNTKIISHFEKYYAETEKFLRLFHKDQACLDAFDMKKLTSFNSYFLYYFFHDDNPKSKREIRKELNTLLKKPVYAKPLKSLKLEYLRTSEKLFVILLKYRLFFMIKLLVKVRNKVKK